MSAFETAGELKSSSEAALSAPNSSVILLRMVFLIWNEIKESPSTFLVFIVKSALTLWILQVLPKHALLASP